MTESGLSDATTRHPRESNRMQSHRLIQRILAAVAIVFGVVTILSGGRVLLGADPGYVVYKPLLVYNTAMGFIYAGAGIAAWRSVVRGRAAAGAIFVLNLIVLAAVGTLYSNGGGAVAIESVHAMTLRTVVWLVLFAGFAWIVRADTVRR